MEESNFIEALRKESNHAYCQLLDEYKNKVFNTCISFVPNTQDAEDLAQEVFVQVFNSINKFNGDSKLSTWIYRITINKCLEFIRKRNTKKRFIFVQFIRGNDIPLDKTGYFTELNHPGIILENKEKSETLFYAINQLPKAQKIVFTLHKVDGRSYQEISDIIQKSVSSVESLMFRAKKNLQKLLEVYYKGNS